MPPPRKSRKSEKTDGEGAREGKSLVAQSVKKAPNARFLYMFFSSSEAFQASEEKRGKGGKKRENWYCGKAGSKRHQSS